MKARFIGRTSMGFQSGRIYTIRSNIEVIRKGGSVFGENMKCICIYDTNSKAWCPYQNLESVMKNWEIFT